jgi:hypothetical protein
MSAEAIASIKIEKLKMIFLGKLVNIDGIIKLAIISGII